MKVVASRDIHLSGEQQDRLAEAIRTWRGSAKLDRLAAMVNVSSKTLARYANREAPSVQRGVLETISVGVGVEPGALTGHVLTGAALPAARISPQTLEEQVADLRREVAELSTLVHSFLPEQDGQR